MPRNSRYSGQKPVSPGTQVKQLISIIIFCAGLRQCAENNRVIMLSHYSARQVLERDLVFKLPPDFPTERSIWLPSRFEV